MRVGLGLHPPIRSNVAFLPVQLNWTFSPSVELRYTVEEVGVEKVGKRRGGGEV